MALLLLLALLLRAREDLLTVQVGGCSEPVNGRVPWLLELAALACRCIDVCMLSVHLRLLQLLLACWHYALTKRSTVRQICNVSIKVLVTARWLYQRSKHPYERWAAASKLTGQLKPRSNLNMLKRRKAYLTGLHLHAVVQTWLFVS